MNYNSLDEIKNAGFTGFKTINELFESTSLVENNKGIYLVLRPVKDSPKFLLEGSGPPLYKKKTNPNVSISALKSNWVENTIVLYIGKAGGTNKQGLEIKETLRGRLRKYMSFGKGNDVTHWGGRLIWQLKDSKELIVCWKKLVEEEPRTIETNLIQDFTLKYGKRPFANLKD